MKTLKKILWLAAVLLCIVSCSKEEVTEKVIEVPEGKVLVETEIVVDGVIQSKTRASSEAGYTTGDGLYDKTDRVTVAAVANDGYELTSFYDKKDPSANLGSSYTFDVLEPRTFKAEFARKYTITVSASPTAGGTVSGGGTYRSGKPCTLTATPNAGYTFDGWYEGSTKLSSNTSYSFTVSSNRTIIGKFTIAAAYLDFSSRTGYYNQYYYKSSRALPFEVQIHILEEGYSMDQEGNEYNEVGSSIGTIKVGSLTSEYFSLDSQEHGWNVMKISYNLRIGNKDVQTWDTYMPNAIYPLCINYTYQGTIYTIVINQRWL